MKAIDKGRKGEREIGRWLYHAWFNETPPADRSVFIRTGLGRRQLTGDLILPDNFPFKSVEVKNRNVNVNDLLAVKGEIADWINKLPVPSLLFVKLSGRWASITIMPLSASLPVTAFTIDLADKRLFLLSLEQLSTVLRYYRQVMGR